MLHYRSDWHRRVELSAAPGTLEFRNHSVDILTVSSSTARSSSDACGRSAAAGASSDGAACTASFSPSAATSGSANGLSLTGLVAVLVGETERVWLTGGDVACGILRMSTVSATEFGLPIKRTSLGSELSFLLCSEEPCLLSRARSPQSQSTCDPE